MSLLFTVRGTCELWYICVSYSTYLLMGYDVTRLFYHPLWYLSTIHIIYTIRLYIYFNVYGFSSAKRWWLWWNDKRWILEISFSFSRNTCCNIINSFSCVSKIWFHSLFFIELTRRWCKNLYKINLFGELRNNILSNQKLSF